MRLLVTASLVALSPLVAPAIAETPPDGPNARVWMVSLEGCQESPGTGSPATGRAVITLSFATGVVTYSIDVTGLTNPITAAHLHGPAARGATAPPLVTLPTAIPSNGSFTPDPSTLGQLHEGRLYLNLHTAEFPDGELRGQIDDRGSGCPPPGDAGVDAPGGDSGAIDAGVAVDDDPKGCHDCAGSSTPSLGVVLVALALRRRRARRGR